MSTRLRPIVMLNGDVVTGGHVRMWLESMVKSLRLEVPPRGSMPEAERLIALYESLPISNLGRTSLWLFREPRNTSPNRSRYAQLAQYYGIGPRLNKKKADLPFTLQVDRIVERARRQRRAEEEIEQARIIERTAREMARMQQGIPAPPTDWQAAAQQAAVPGAQAQFVSSSWGPTIGNPTPRTATSDLFSYRQYAWDPPIWNPPPEREEP